MHLCAISSGSANRDPGPGTPNWRWGEAMTLAERAQLLRAPGADRSERAPGSARAERRLAKWKAQPPFESGALFAQRLQQAGLTEADLLRWLSERRVPEGAGWELSSWAIELSEALDNGATPAGLAAAVLKGDTPAAQLHFLELVRPLIERSIERLHGGIKTLATANPAAPFEPNTIGALLSEALPDRLLPLCLRTMALEVNVARLQGLLTGDTGEQRLESFIARLRQPEVRRELFREYPVLGRLAVTALQQWVDCSLEFLERLCADWPAVCRTLSPTADPGPVVKLEGNAGDCHRGGRSVWIVEFRSGLKVVYKPRSLAVDRHFQELLGWLNDRGFCAPFRQLKIQDRGEYGWEEFVLAEGCSSREEVVRFYERAGGYLPLLRGLAATDFHLENLIAAGEQPTLIDLEALFHGSGLEPEAREAGDLAGKSFADSVLGSGLLPTPLWSARNGDVIDASGLGADLGKKLPIRRPAWKDAGTDQMQFGREDAVIDSAEHQPRLNGVPAKPLEYRDALERGFTQVYRLLEEHRDEWLAPGGWLERFAGDEVRVVLRNTSRYAELLQEGSHPDVLRDALDRDRLFDRLWEEVRDRPRLAELLPAELEDLWRGDVPLFTTQPGSRDLWAGPDRRFKDIQNQSGLDRARERFRGFGSNDLKRQLWFLRSSLSTLAAGTRPALRSRQTQQKTPVAAVTREQLLGVCCGIGDRLAETAQHGEGDVAWVGLSALPGEKWVLVPLGLDLYDGVPGIALFLAYLGAVTGQEHYTTLARATLETMRRWLQPDRWKKGFEEIGGFVGWGGVLYSLAHLGVLWRSPDLLAEAHELLAALPERIGKDTRLDLLSGAAGCIAGLLCLYSCSPSPRLLELAVRCGERLLSQAHDMPQGLAWDSPFPARGPLTGFSHGAAGIAWALLELAAATGENRFRTAGLGGIAYERSLFSAEAGNWPDLRLLDRGRKAEGDGPAPFHVAWCHGAPGIGLGRLLCRRHVAEPLLDEEIKAAVRTTLAAGFGMNHSLCHGELGNLELLFEAARVFPDSSWEADARRLLDQIVASIKRDGWLCGNPLAVESPGLMTGIAGIGYGLLRCAEPARVPSVLSLAPPNTCSAPAASNRRGHAFNGTQLAAPPPHIGTRFSRSAGVCLNSEEHKPQPPPNLNRHDHCQSQ